MNEFKYWIKKNFPRWLYRRKASASRLKRLVQFMEQFEPQSPAKLSDVSFDIFTYHGEDGIIFYLIKELELAAVPQCFIDIGSGDCITSNCAFPAAHLHWDGIFIDKNEKQLAIGKNFYKERDDIRFISETVTMENINTLIKKIDTRAVGLLSIDIDGNDYWIWKAIDSIEPRIVVIEAKVEFGNRDIVVPYGPDNHHSVNEKLNGASVEALRKLGVEKGYKLVGANRYGYNLFFVKEDEPIPAVTSESVLTDPETIASFYPI